MNILTSYEIKAGIKIKDLSEQEIEKRIELKKSVDNFFKKLKEFNKLSEEEKSKRIFIGKF